MRLFGTLNTICIDMMALIFLDNMFAGIETRTAACYRTKYGIGIYYRCPNPNIHAFYWWCCCKRCVGHGCSLRRTLIAVLFTSLFYMSVCVHVVHVRTGYMYIKSMTT